LKLPVRRLLEETSSWELTAWLAYFKAADEKRHADAERQKFAQSIGAD
jgi:hypothetical protein